MSQRDIILAMSNHIQGNQGLLCQLHQCQRTHILQRGDDIFNSDDIVLQNRDRILSNDPSSKTI